MRTFLLLLLMSSVLFGITSLDIAVWANGYATKPEVEWELIAAIAEVESNTDPLAYSSEGAMGMYQFTPIAIYDVAVRFRYEFSPFNPRTSTIAAKIYLSWLLSKLSFRDAVAAWNCGYSNVIKGQIPYQTLCYLRKVEVVYERLKIP